jgi:hypothetical protein
MDSQAVLALPGKFFPLAQNAAILNFPAGRRGNYRPVEPASHQKQKTLAL